MWKKIRIVINSYHLLLLVGIEINVDEMGGACSTYVRGEDSNQTIGRKIIREKTKCEAWVQTVW
jgi:hypothetical protein